jgi:chromate transporter
MDRPTSQTPTTVTFGEAFRLWVKVGLLSFGGPAGQIATMHRLIVEERKWVGEARFLHALNYCMLLPGPEAQQLAIYIGWLLHRTAGGLVAGILFVLPGALVMWMLSVLYVGFQDLTFVQAIFYGIKAAVLAVVIEALVRIGKRALRNATMVTLAGFAFVGIFFFEIPFPLIILGAAVIGFLGARSAPSTFVPAGKKEEESALLDVAFAAGRLDHTRPGARRALIVLAVWLTLWFGPLLALIAVFGLGHVFVDEGIFFSKMAMVTFGGAYAVLAYVAQQAVETYRWLEPGEMLDGLGLAETTPGPLILVLQFVGFLAAYRNPGTLDPMIAGTLGAAITTYMTFVPCFLWIFLGAPFIESLRGNKALTGALTAITAAVVGVILNLAVWFALHVLFHDVVETHAYGVKLVLPTLSSLDWQAALLAVAAAVAMLRFHINMMLVLAASAAVGALLYYI